MRALVLILELHRLLKCPYLTEHSTNVNHSCLYSKPLAMRWYYYSHVTKEKRVSERPSGLTPDHIICYMHIWYDSIVNNFRNSGTLTITSNKWHRAHFSTDRDTSGQTERSITMSTAVSCIPSCLSGIVLRKCLRIPLDNLVGTWIPVLQIRKQALRGAMRVNWLLY